MRTEPAFAGQSYGNAGPYEHIIARAYGEVDPADPKNAIIQDLNLAPRNARDEGHAFRTVKPAQRPHLSRTPPAIMGTRRRAARRAGQLAHGELRLALWLAGRCAQDGCVRARHGDDKLYVLVC